VNATGTSPARTPLLAIEGLSISFGRRDTSPAAVRDVSLTVGRGEVVGLVGESGSGKSLTCRSVLRLLPAGGHIREGSVTFEDRDVLALTPAELRDLRAHEVGMIFQDPFTSLNPTFRVGEQLSETLRVNVGLRRTQARQRAIELLDRVEIDNPQRRYNAYPHELSGGMRQRVMIALAIAGRPKLLVADEPTTALDVTTQAQILTLLLQLRQEEDMAVLLVSHDFGVIAQVCDRVAVMYGGYVVEAGTVERVYAQPEHPYTRALLESIPDLQAAGTGRRRLGIPGQPPGPDEATTGCPFAPRCAMARPDCTTIPMRLQDVGDGHLTACPFERRPTSGSVLPPSEAQGASGR
jgi:oligopeptide/dipeptide ABC transporter ATP-binding protein